MRYKLELSLMELAELLYACEAAIQKETELAQQYKETMPWKANRYAQSTADLINAREKIKEAMKGR